MCVDVRVRFACLRVCIYVIMPAQLLQTTLGSHEKSIRSVASKAIAKIVAIEVPEGKWPDIVPVLHHNIILRRHFSFIIDILSWSLVIMVSL